MEPVVIRVAIIDDDHALRNGLRTVIDAVEGLSCSGAFSSSLPARAAKSPLLEQTTPTVHAKAVRSCAWSWLPATAAAIARCGPVARSRPLTSFAMCLDREAASWDRPAKMSLTADARFSKRINRFFNVGIRRSGDIACAALPDSDRCRLAVLPALAQ